MNANEFVQRLDAEIAVMLEKLSSLSAREPGEQLTVAGLLVLALKNELEAAEEAAMWMASENDVEVKLSLARQCGDEAKHYRLIEARLRALGVAIPDPTSTPPSPMYKWLESLGTTIERVAAGPYAREGLAKVRNKVFADFCATRGDHETAALYRDTIDPDEAHHHALGRKLLLRFAITEEAQTKARAAAMHTLSLAEEIQETARIKRGVACAPGC